MITGTEIRAEHEAALASLSPMQAMAVKRLLSAASMVEFSQETRELRLDRLFVLEARERNALAERLAADGR